jgi:hypothetical protein
MAKEPKTVVATDKDIRELLAAKTGFNNISLADFKKFLKRQKNPSGKGYTLAQVKNTLRTATPSAVRDAVFSPISEATPSPARSATPSPARSATPSPARSATLSGKIKTGKQADDLSAAIKGAKKALTKAKTRAENAAEQAGADYKSSKRRKPSQDVELAASSKKDNKRAAPLSKKGIKSKYADDVVATKKTKGGDYYKFKRDSEGAKAFRKAFRDAKGKDFPFDGRMYSGKSAARGMSVSRKRTGHTDFRKGGLFK